MESDHASDFLYQPGTLEWLFEILGKLLGQNGCPWDQEQTLETLKPFLLEECYEVLDAIDENDKDHLCEELGDLLFQIVFQAQLAKITSEEIIKGIGNKLIRRHPHVFGNLQVKDSKEVLRNWEKLKASESTKKRQKLSAAGKTPIDCSIKELLKLWEKIKK